MADIQYSNLSYLDSSVGPLDKSQTSFLKLNNCLTNKQKGLVHLRGGSSYLYSPGTVWGISSYSQKDFINIAANTTIPIRYRQSGASFYVEKYDWTLDLWTQILPESTSYLSFAGNAVPTMVQISDQFIVAAGRLAKISDIATGTITRLGGSAPTTAPTVTASSTGITGTVTYAYTFYDPTTGWESSPSPLSSTLTLTDDGVVISAMATTADREGVTKKRIYRTEISGDFPLLYLAEIDLSVSSYTDDGTALLGDNAPDTADHEPPEDDVYLIESHAGRLWYAKNDTLYCSSVFDGSYYNLEYFADSRSFNFPFVIKGIKSAPQIGGLLVFGSPGMGIWIITGSSEDDFENISYMAGEGTNFHHSITVKDNSIVYWGATSPRKILDNDIVSDFGVGIAQYIEDYTNTSFTSAMYVWSVWHEDTGQYLFGLAGENADYIAVIDKNSLVINCLDGYGNFVAVTG